MEAISRAEGGVSAEKGSPSGSFFGEETQNLQWSKKNRDMFLRIHMTPVSQIKGRPMFTASSVIMFRSDSRPTTCLVGDRNKRMARQIATQLGEAPLPFVTSQGDILQRYFSEECDGKGWTILLSERSTDATTQRRGTRFPRGNFKHSASLNVLMCWYYYYEKQNKVYCQVASLFLRISACVAFKRSAPSSPPPPLPFGN